jgi:hypothetical protein
MSARVRSQAGQHAVAHGRRGPGYRRRGERAHDRQLRDGEVRGGKLFDDNAQVNRRGTAAAQVAVPVDRAARGRDLLPREPCDRVAQRLLLS